MLRLTISNYSLGVLYTYDKLEGGQRNETRVKSKRTKIILCGMLLYYGCYITAVQCDMNYRY